MENKKVRFLYQLVDTERLGYYLNEQFSSRSYDYYPESSKIIATKDFRGAEDNKFNKEILLDKDSSEEVLKAFKSIEIRHEDKYVQPEINN